MQFRLFDELTSSTLIVFREIVRLLKSVFSNNQQKVTKKTDRLLILRKKVKSTKLNKFLKKEIQASILKETRGLDITLKKFQTLQNLIRKSHGQLTWLHFKLAKEYLHFHKDKLFIKVNSMDIVILTFFKFLPLYF